jgi:hypothetical protein
MYSRRLAFIGSLSLIVACAVGSTDDSTEPYAAPTATSSSEPAPSPRGTSSNPGPASTGGSNADASTASTDGGSDSGASSSGGACAGYAKPTTIATCHSCGTRPCQANGCYGSYYCELSSKKCVPKPSGC